MPFKTLPSRIPETRKNGETPARMVRRLAVQKALATARKLRSRPSLVVGSDTVVVLKGKVFGKPRSSAHASSMLMELSGNIHRVYTGVAVADSGTLRSVSAVDAARVRFRRISLDEARFIGRKHLDKAGSYAFQDDGDGLVQSVDGDWQTVVGLPMRTLKRLLNKFR